MIVPPISFVNFKVDPRVQLIEIASIFSHRHGQSWAVGKTLVFFKLPAYVPWQPKLFERSLTEAILQGKLGVPHLFLGVSLQSSHF